MVSLRGLTLTAARPRIIVPLFARCVKLRFFFACTCGFYTVK